MNSHITVPHSIFKEFADNNNHLYKYEIENDRISRGFPRSTYTEEGYYSDFIEAALNKHVETPLKKLINYAKQLPKDKVFVRDDEIIKIAKLYVKALFARSPLVCKKAIDESIFLQFAETTNQEDHDLVVDIVMSSDDFEMISQEFTYTFMVNLTQTPFVIPTSGMYGFTMSSAKCINVPLTPWCAILMKEKGKVLLGEKPNDAFIVPVGSDNIMMKLNKFALESQKRDNIGYIVSGEKNILEQLAL